MFILLYKAAQSNLCEVTNEGGVRKCDRTHRCLKLNSLKLQYEKLYEYDCTGGWVLIWTDSHYNSTSSVLFRLPVYCLLSS